MKTKPWAWTQNSIWNATKKSFKKFRKMSRKHDDALFARLGDPFFDGMYAIYHPLHVAWMSAYDAWQSAGESQQGTTKSVKTLLEELSRELIIVWDNKIQAVYPSYTDEYKGILPHGHQPFQSGSQDDRITTVNALLIKVNADAALIDLKTPVTRFVNDITAAMQKKDGNISNTKLAPKQLKVMQQEACEVMFDDLLDLLKHFRTNRTAVEVFFDMGILRDRRQDEFDEAINKNTTKDLAKRTMEADEKMKIKVYAAPIRVYSVADIDQKTSDVYVDLAPNDIYTVTPVQIGNNKDKPFIKIQNMSDVVDGRFELEFEELPLLP